MKKSDLELSTPRRRCLSVCGTAQWRRDAWMLFKKCVCVNPTSGSWGFFDPLRDREEKKTIHRISSGQQEVTSSAIVQCRVPACCGHSATFDSHTYSPTIAMLPFLSMSLSFPFLFPVFIPLFNPLKTKRRLLYLNTQFAPRTKHFSSRL